MYGVDLDLAGNYLLLGGSGDEYSYTATNADGWMSDIWVSYLVVVDPQVLNAFLENNSFVIKCNNCDMYLFRETLCSKESLVTKLAIVLGNTSALINKLEKSWFMLMLIPLAEDLVS